MRTISKIHPDFLQMTDFIMGIPIVFDYMDGKIFENRNILKVQVVSNKVIVIKSYGKIYFFNKLMYRFFRKSKGERAYEFASYLIKHGINTPQPIAFLNVQSKFLCERGFFVSEYINFKPISTVREMASDQWKTVLSGLANFIVQMHANRFLHLDCSASNLLFNLTDGTYSFSVLDINRSRITHVSPANGIKSLRKFGLPLLQMTFLIEEYALRRGIDTNKGLQYFFGYRYRHELRGRRKKWLKNSRNVFLELLTAKPL